MYKHISKSYFLLPVVSVHATLLSCWGVHASGRCHVETLPHISTILRAWLHWITTGRSYPATSFPSWPDRGVCCEWLHFHKFSSVLQEEMGVLEELPTGLIRPSWMRKCGPCYGSPWDQWPFYYDLPSGQLFDLGDKLACGGSLGSILLLYRSSSWTSIDASTPPRN
jgi:hypothetical protein